MPAPRPHRIDDQVRGDHYYLTEDDRCFYLREYTSGQGYQHSRTNDLISNLKKGPERRANPNEWRHKERAIVELGLELRGALEGSRLLLEATLVPMPPSRAKDDPGFDDRMMRVLRVLDNGRGLDARELLYQEGSREPMHASAGGRLRPEEHYQRLRVDEALASPAPTRIWLFDDVLVTGAQFKAGKQRLEEHFPGVPVFGIFLSRRAIPSEEVD